jgi:iron complex transport system ATP-binding protein
MTSDNRKNTTPDTPLDARDLTVRYRRDDPAVIADQSIQLQQGKITALVGPNGSGKSTLLKTLARHLDAERGAVLLDGRNVHDLSPRQLARRLGILFQEHAAPGGMTVGQLVQHGRYPHRGFFDPMSEQDFAAVDRAFELAGIEHLRSRRVDELSGGQKQLAWVAMVLAQQPSVLLLDEPTTFLDLRHQLEVMRIVERLRDEHRTTIALVLHDLNQAARHCDRLVAMQAGRIVAAGSPWQVLSAALLRDVFQVEAEVLNDAAGLPVCVPRSIAAP